MVKTPLYEPIRDQHVLITGGTGFIGRALVERFLADNNQVSVLSRDPSRYRRHFSQTINLMESLDEIPDDIRVDSIINLAGEPLVGKRWSERQKQEIVASRVDTTREVVDLIERLNTKPDVLINGSAIGWYGHQGDARLGEQSSARPGFSNSLCQAWEDVALSANDYCRVCLLRIGIVLAADGGSLKQMKLPFSLGLGGRIGKGSQWMSWIDRRDLIRVIVFLISNTSMKGAVNATAPTPVTNAEFTRTLAAVLRRPAIFPMPAFGARLLFGEMAHELLLNGQRVIPEKLLQAGFEFTHTELASSLETNYS